MSAIRVKNTRVKIFTAAVATVAAHSAFGQSNVQPGQIVISAAGSTALKNWIVAKTTTFTEIQPYNPSVPGSGTLSINGVSYPPASDGGTSYWFNYPNGGTGQLYQLAPKTNNSIQGTSADQSPAIQFVYHESGSVEGSLELANDQLYTNSNYAASTGIPSTSIAYVTQNVDRNPEGGNAVWLNYNQIGASGATAGATFNATSGANVNNGLTLGNFYASGVGQATTPGQTGTAWAQGSLTNPTPTFNQAGANVNGGQNAVQFALSDVTPQQEFQNTYGDTTNTFIPASSGTPQTVTGFANSSFNSNPLDLGYGDGNSAIPAVGSPGTAGIRAAYQSASVLNMPADAQNPRAPQGTTFGVGAWNNAADGGIGNVNVQLTAITATALVSNPGTGLTQIDRTDADWLDLTGRLKNGAVFNMTTRDVNSGTRNVFANNIGVDPTYAVGKDDDGNGNLPNGVTNSLFDQRSIGPDLRFSNKTAGGAQLRPTVQDNRMAVGTLSINDAGGNDTQSVANPVRVLSYSDSVDGSSPYVSPNFATISNGTYVIYQNEEVLTLRAPGANYDDNTVVTNANGAQIIQGQVQGDDADGDVVTLLNNVANSVATASGASTPANPADGLLQQGYIIPSLMQVKKNFDGQGLINSIPGQIDTGQIESQSNLPADGGNFNQGLYNTYASTYGPSALPNLTTQQPTTGTGSTYGGAGGTFAKNFYNGGAIPITANNYLFGNFNQNGVRDYNAAVKSALDADVALITADQAVGASVPGSEFTSAGDNNGVAGGVSGVPNTTVIPYTDALGAPIATLTKGDLIVMGDFNGDGHFDGADLVALAEGAALSDNTGTDRLTTANYQTGVLDKNSAMDYLNANVGTTGADLYIRQSGRAILEAATVPAGATPVLSPITGTQVVDPVSGLLEFSYDPNGTNTFNKSDVNQDGVVDFNDAVLVDKNNGQDYTNLGDQVASTEQAPVTGNIVPLSLAMVKQSDGSSVIDSSDLAVINGQLTGAANANWYDYNLQKTGPGTIDWERTGGTVTVYSGASFEISAGIVDVGGSVDPFADNNSGGPTAGNHLAVTVDNTGTIEYAATASGGTATISAASLPVVTGGGKIDVGGGTLIVNYGSGADPASTIRGYLVSGYNSTGGTAGNWQGAGITSSLAAENPSSFAVGYADGNNATDAANTGVAPGTVEIKYTVAGDANLSGTVDLSDLVIVASDFGSSGADWAQGDVNYDGNVDLSDLVIVASNFGSSLSSVQTAQFSGSFAAEWKLALTEVHGADVSVPEPGTVGLAAAGAAGLLARRRRRR
jgi:PEP-CTERM motif